MSVNDEVQMELEMLKAIAGEDNVDEPQLRPEDSSCPPALREIPSVRILVAKAMDVQPELVLWIGFHDSNYPGQGGEECVPKIEVLLEENAPIKHRPEAFTEMAREAAKAEGGQMCINQVYQRIVDGMLEAEEAEAKKAAAKAGGKDDGDAHSGFVDPTIRLGTQLTPEVFKEWKAKFDAENAAKKLKQMGKKAIAEAAAQQDAKKMKLTGKQMWDQSIKNADWELFEKAGSGNTGDDDDDGEDIDFVFGDDDDEDENDEFNEANYEFGEEDE